MDDCLAKDTLKSRLKNQKLIMPIKNNIIDKTTKSMWVKCKKDLDNFLDGSEQISFDKHFHFIAYLKYYQMGGQTFWGLPAYITIHPYLPEFKKYIKSTPIDIILNHLESSYSSN